MPYPIGPKTETGWPYECVRCGTVFFRRCKNFSTKYCNDCAVLANLEHKNEEYARKVAEREARREARKKAGPPGGTDYCKRMHMTNPGKMCGTRDFCLGCEFAGDGACRDSEEFGR